VLFTSALTGRGIQRIAPLAAKLWELANRRISTPDLNRFLERAVAAHQPPSYRSAIVRVRYMTQVRITPPTFVAFTNHPEGIHESWNRFLENRLREEFGFEGVPVVLMFRKNDEGPRKGSRGQPTRTKNSGQKKKRGRAPESERA